MNNRPAIEAVIFDCDGVLVDSEMLSAAVLKEMMAEINFPMTDDIFQDDFLGRSFANAAPRAAKRFGRPLPDNFQFRYRERLLARMKRELQPMAGVFEMLKSLAAPYWLATGSSPQRLTLSLSVTMLDSYFAGRCSTASEVRYGKPAPDLFLHSAQRAGFDPKRCLVIEDSEMGISAARAAGMWVWHFQGGAHTKAGYRLPAGVRPDRVIADMAGLGDAFAELGLCTHMKVPLG